MIIVDHLYHLKNCCVVLVGMIDGQQRPFNNLFLVFYMTSMDTRVKHMLEFHDT